MKNNNLFPLYLFFLVIHFILMACHNNVTSDPSKTQGSILQVKESKSVYSMKNDHALLSSFKKSVFSKKIGLISLASYLDFSTGLSRSIQQIYYHEENKSYNLPEQYTENEILAIDQPSDTKLPLLVAHRFNENMITIPHLLIWDLEKKEVITDIEISNYFFQSKSEFYKSFTDTNNEKNDFPFPILFSNFNNSCPRILFQNESEVSIIFPTFGTLVGYQIHLSKKTVSEFLLAGPSNALFYPPYFYLTETENSLTIDAILMQGQESFINLGLKKMTLPLGENPIAHIDWKIKGEKQGQIQGHLFDDSLSIFKPDVYSYLNFLSPNQFYKSYHKKWSVNENDYLLEFYNKGMKYMKLEIHASSFKVNWSGLYQNRYIVLVGETGDISAPTFSLIKAGSLFVIILDQEKKKIVLASEYYTGQKHRIVSAGIDSQKLWISYNHNWGGNHDGETVRKTTSGRSFTIDLPEIIQENTSLQLALDPDLFRPLNQETQIKLVDP